MKPLRVYADTSVFGGCFDAEFAAESKRFLDLVRTGRVKLLVSEVVVREVSKAPARVVELLRSLPADCPWGCLTAMSLQTSGERTRR